MALPAWDSRAECGYRKLYERFGYKQVEVSLMKKL